MAVVGAREAEEAVVLEVHHHIPPREISQGVPNTENYLTLPIPRSRRERMDNMFELLTSTQFAHLEDQTGAAEAALASRVLAVDMSQIDSPAHSPTDVTLPLNPST